MKVKYLLINALGFLFLGIGAVGLFMPLLPTTPFVLLATVCFSYSNRRIYERLKRTPFFGSFIVNFEEKQGIPMSLKITSIILVWVSLSISMIALHILWAYILLGIIGVGVTIHLLTIKTKKPMQYTIFNGVDEQNANDAIHEKNCG
ncbi:MAG: YbaN family protein [Defluviitaleaceae bacterium]|nr:YbaN family protein [Defluviitaleaceae bacterium]